MRARKRFIKFTTDEVGLAFMILARLNPEQYEDDEAKAVINKCRAAAQEDHYDGWSLSQ